MAGGKRTATSDLNHENWDREETAEEAGSFKKATEDVLQKRIIKRALRRNLPGEDVPASKNSIFGNFNAFSKPPTNLNPVAAFNFLNEPKKNGVGVLGLENSKETKTTENEAVDNDYYAKLKGLNEGVAKWIKQHVEANPLINLRPVFDDYAKYFSEIEKEKGKNVVICHTFGTSTNQKLENIIMGKIQDAKEIDPKKCNFGLVSSTSSITSTPTFSFTSNITKPSFTFGPPQSTAPFSFGNNMKKEETKEKLETNEKQNDDEDAPPKVEFTPVVESDHLYTVRCKVFVKKNENFGDRGVGHLFLKEVPDSKKIQLIVRADTNLGNLLCNFILSESIPTKRMGKKDVMLVCIPTPDTKPPPVPILLRVKSAEEADELLNILEKYKN